MHVMYRVFITIISIFFACMALIHLMAWSLHRGEVNFLRMEPLHSCENEPEAAQSGGTSKTVWLERDGDDRIVDQMRYIPESYRRRKTNGSNSRRGRPEMRIMLFDGFGPMNVKPNQRVFEGQCAVDQCQLFDPSESAENYDYDAILFNQLIEDPGLSRKPRELWIYYMLESPRNSVQLPSTAGLVNCTATYRTDSTIVTPYGKWVPSEIDGRSTETRRRNYAAGKTKKVAWFVSNCASENNRMNYTIGLQQHIAVDVYGSCGTLQCDRNDGSACSDMLNRDYKFYLSFENSNCRDYITEKFFVNGLKNDIIPIVMGARKEDYRKVAPPRSYIHVEDFESPEELAAYLHVLDKNDTLYNSYFDWKGKGEFINTKFWCRLCALLHDDRRPNMIVDDLQNWWHPPGTCVDDRWT